MGHLHVTLPDDLTDFVEARAREDDSSANAYVAGLVAREQARLELREKLLQGANDDFATPADADYFDALRARIRSGPIDS